MTELGYRERRMLNEQIKHKEVELDTLYVKIANGSATQRDYTRRRCLELSIESMRQRLIPKRDDRCELGISIMR